MLVKDLKALCEVHGIVYKGVKVWDMGRFFYVWKI
jgi:hypothetical protein